MAYVRAGNLWVVRGDAAPLQLTTGGNDTAPHLTPDGQQILFRRSVPPGPAGLSRFELWVIEIDGSGARRLVAPTDLPGELGTPMGAEGEVLLDRLPFEVRWLPLGERVAFNTLIEGGYCLLTNDDLWLVDVGTGALTRLLADGEGGSFAFSPDETSLIVSTPTTVSMLNADGTNRRLLVSFDFVNTASEYAYVPAPLWAPDGSYGLIAIQSAEPFGDDPQGRLWQLPRTGDAVQLNTLPGIFLFHTMGENRLWSPDRSRFAYVGPDWEQLFIADGAGNGAELYATGRAEFYGWSPDNARFIYSLGAPSTFFIGEQGSAPQPLLPPGETGQVLNARWVSPSHFAYSVGDFAAAEIRLGELGGAHRTLATDAQGFDVVGTPE